MNILEIKDVTYNYSNSREKVLSSVNQKFELGQFYAIIGKSGLISLSFLTIFTVSFPPETLTILAPVCNILCSKSSFKETIVKTTGISKANG